MNPKPALILSLPEPCGEDWNQMNPDGCGRFCVACQKTVIDFTVMTDAEIVNVFRNSETIPCGRFFPGQLNRPLQEPQNAKPFPFYRKIAAAILALQTFTIHSFAQAKKKAATVYHKKTTQDQKQQVVKGRVLNLETSEPITGLLFLVTAPNVDSFYTTTDTAGYFRFTLPDSAKQIHILAEETDCSVNETIDLSSHPANIFIFSHARRLLPKAETTIHPNAVRTHEVIMGIPSKPIEPLPLRKPTLWHYIKPTSR